MAHGAGWYAFMQGQEDKQRREKERAEREQWKYEHMVGRTCPKCGGNLLFRDGKNGRFIGCENYPECRYTESGTSRDDNGLVCPKCGKRLVKREGKYGPFMGCAGYPACKYIKK